MSYLKVKSIGIKSDEVTITAGPNNLRPIRYNKEVSKPLTDILLKEGKKEVIKEILLGYWAGELQPGTKNNYYKVKRLFDIYYPHINWDTELTDDKYNQLSDAEKHRYYSRSQVKEFLYDMYLFYKNRNKEKHVLQKTNEGYITKKKGVVYTTLFKDQATVFNSYLDALFEVYELEASPLALSRDNLTIEKYHKEKEYV